MPADDTASNQAITMPADNSDPSNDPKKQRGYLSRYVWPLVKVGMSLGVPTAIGIGTITFDAKTGAISKHYATQLIEGKSGAGYHTRIVKTPPPALSPFAKRMGYDVVRDDALIAKEDMSNSEQVEYPVSTLFGVDAYPSVFPKTNPGLRIIDAQGEPLYTYERPAFKSFDEIPPLLWQSLLLTENKELLNGNNGDKNLTIEWDRIINAVWDRMQGKTGSVSGIMAQSIKIIHSPDGKTGGKLDEKAKQLETAMMEYYKDKDWKKFVVAYMNIVPFAATKQDGEIFGFAEGMHAWYGRSVDDLKILNRPDSELNPEEFKLKAQVFREAYSLIMSLKKPSAFLNKPLKKSVVEGVNARVTAKEITEKQAAEILCTLKKESRDRGVADMNARINLNLTEKALQKAFKKAEIYRFLSPEFATEVSGLTANPVDPETQVRTARPSPYKFVNNLRGDIHRILKDPSQLDTDRRDMTAQTTLVAAMNRAATKFGEDLHNPAFLTTIGLAGGSDARFMFHENDAPFIKFAQIIYQLMPDGSSHEIVHVDNLGDDPLDLISGSKLEEGSTAKIRFGLEPMHYIEKRLHTRYADKTPEELRKKLATVHPTDNHTRWVLNYLLDPAKDKSWKAMLLASHERTYSGNPAGLPFPLPIKNFKFEENKWNKSVSINTHASVNAAFVRIMIDNVNYFIHEELGIDEDLYNNPNDPRRIPLLEEFVKSEGTVFLVRALESQKGKTADEIEQSLIKGTKFRSAGQIAALFRYLHPEGSVEDMKDYILKNAAPNEVAKLLSHNAPAKVSKTPKPSVDPFERLYVQYAPGVYEQPAKTKVNKKTGEVKKYSAVHDLNERSYKLKIRPENLWLAQIKINHPNATWSGIKDAAASTNNVSGKSMFTQANSWLFKDSKHLAQNRSLRSIVRHKAFELILHHVQELGYSIDKVIDSELIVLGANGDKPRDLARLMGLLANGGVLVNPDTWMVWNRAENTIYRRESKPNPHPHKQVVDPDSAALIIKEMRGVVTDPDGTGSRLKDPEKFSGVAAPFAVKTGSGFNAEKNSAGKIINVKNQTGTLMFSQCDDTPPSPLLPAPSPMSPPPLRGCFYGVTLLYIDGKLVEDPQTHKIINPAERAKFTSAVAAQATKYLYSTPEYQTYMRQAFYGASLTGAPPLPVIKPPVPPKPAPTPKPGHPKAVITPNGTEKAKPKVISLAEMSLAVA